MAILPGLVRSVRMSTSVSVRPSRALLVAGIVLVALNLRPALAAVGPLVAAMRDDTGLSNTALGLITTLPLLAFGLVSALTPVATRRLGVEGALGLALALIAGGILVRSIPGTALLFGGTVVLGVGIALGNVLLPSLVKRDFSDRVGPMTSLYSSAMGVGATLAAGASVPLMAATGGWRVALGAWAVLAVVGLVVWAPQISRRAPVVPRGSVLASLKDLGRSRIAWAVALFMGLQSFTFYVILAWVPDLLQARGLSAEEAGWMLALSQGTGIAGSALVPLWAGRRTNQVAAIAALMLIEGIGIAGLMMPGTALAGLWVGGIGFALGGSFGLSLLLIALRAADAETSAELSGMAQSVGYLVAATGPAVVGALHDATSGWTVPLLSLVAVLVVKTVAGVLAGREGIVSVGARS